MGRGNEVTVTNDGATILKSIYIDNPAAKVLVGEWGAAHAPAPATQAGVVGWLRRLRRRRTQGGVGLWGWLGRRGGGVCLVVAVAANQC